MLRVSKERERAMIARDHYVGNVSEQIVALCFILDKGSVKSHGQVQPLTQGQRTRREFQLDVLRAIKGQVAEQDKLSHFSRSWLRHYVRVRTTGKHHWVKEGKHVPVEY